MKIRSLPFGYRIRDGKVCVDERNSSTVRMIFEGYIQNASYQKLADTLERQGTPYIPEKHWNKNIVARILKDRHYIGDEEYPPIIAQDVFQRAEAANTWSCDSPERTRLVKNLRSMVCCPICGGIMIRNYKAHWRCPDCMDTSVKVTDEVLERSAAELLKQSGRTASHMEVPDSSFKVETVQGLEVELLQALDEAEFDETAAKDRAIALASAQFDALGSKDYETMRLKYILSNKEQDGGFDAGLFFDIASAILIYPSGAVSLKLKNGIIIEKECST